MVNKETFIKFLQKQKINYELWNKKNKEKLQKVEEEFYYLGEKAFYERKRFLMNKWRKKYPME